MAITKIGCSKVGSREMVVAHGDSEAWPWARGWSSARRFHGSEHGPLQWSTKRIKVGYSLTREMGRPESKFIKAVFGGWPAMLSSLKSFLETGEPIPATRSLPKDSSD